MHSLFSRSRTAPTGYEKVRLLFHAIRLFQLISSLVVGSIVFYFIWWLIHDHYPVYWTFIILTITSITTITCLTGTILLHLLTGLNPRLNLILNTAMLFAWSLGWTLLFRWTTLLLSSSCSAAQWNHPGGAMICRLYKTLFSFSLLGLLSTAAALALDLHIHRLATRFGKHMRLDNDAALKARRVVDVRPDMDAAGRTSEAFEIPEGFGTRYDPVKEKMLAGEGYAAVGGEGHDTAYKGFEGGVGVAK